MLKRCSAAYFNNDLSKSSCMLIRAISLSSESEWWSHFAGVANAQIVRRRRRGHVDQPNFWPDPRDRLCTLHGRHMGGERLHHGVHDSKPLPPLARRGSADGCFYSSPQRKGKGGR